LSKYSITPSPSSGETCTEVYVRHEKGDFAIFSIVRPPTDKGATKPSNTFIEEYPVYVETTTGVLIFPIVGLEDLCFARFDPVEKRLSRSGVRELQNVFVSVADSMGLSIPKTELSRLENTFTEPWFICKIGNVFFEDEVYSVAAEVIESGYGAHLLDRVIGKDGYLYPLEKLSQIIFSHGVRTGARKPPRQQIITVRSSHRPTRQRAPRSHHRVAVSTRGGDSGDDESGESDPPAPPLSWRSCPYHRLPSHNPQLLEPLQPFPCGDVSRGRYRRRSFVVDSGRCAA